MRKVAIISPPKGGIVRAMIYEADGGAFLFLYTSLEDGPCEFDEWYGLSADAESEANLRFLLKPEDWKLIDDPLEGAQSDWICPTRVKLDSTGNKLWGQFESIPLAS